MLWDRCLSCLSVSLVCNVGVLWANSWIDQDKTWRAGRPRPWPHCFRWGPNCPSPKGAQLPVFGQCVLWPNGWMSGWIKMPLNREVGLGPGDIVLDGDPAPLPNKGAQQPPLFGPCLLWPNGWIDQDATWYGGRPRPGPHCVRWGPAPHPRKDHSPLVSARVCCCQKRKERVFI